MAENVGLYISFRIPVTREIEGKQLDSIEYMIFIAFHTKYKKLSMEFRVKTKI